MATPKLNPVPSSTSPLSRPDAPALEILSPPSPSASITPIPQLFPRARIGKVARLPYLERDMVNRMLRNNISHAQIVGALQEHGYRVTLRNISNWKTRGGYRDWCAEQDRALENHILQDNLAEHLRKTDATQLPEVGLQLAATNLSRFFLKPETQQQLTTDPNKCSRALADLCRLTHHLHNLQKYRDDAAKAIGQNPEAIKQQAENAVELTRNIFSAERLGFTADADPSLPHRNYMPRSRAQPL